MSIEFIDDVEMYDLGKHLWSGGYDTWKAIYDADKEDSLEEFLQEVFADTTPTITQINDMLWFDSSTVFEAVGLDSDGEEIIDLDGDDGFISDKYLEKLEEEFSEEVSYLDFSVEEVGKVALNDEVHEPDTYTTMKISFSSPVDTTAISEDDYNTFINALQDMNRVDTNFRGKITLDIQIHVNDFGKSYAELKAEQKIPEFTIDVKQTGRILRPTMDILIDFMDKIYDLPDDFGIEEE